MKEPEIPDNEQARLNALQKLDILNTLPEERFDRITRMATHMFGVDTALVSLVDSNRQWFKSKQGLGASETPRNISFCGHAILGNEIFEIKNASNDERFSDNPLVTDDPNIRFYAGRPLNTKEGFKVGTLCLIHPQPRELTTDEKQLLNDLGQMVEDELNTLALALTDELTGLANRRGFIEIGNHVLALSVRVERSVDVVFFDLNKFKPINDQYGHEAGDKVLKEFAAALINQFRESDVVGRLGGDEFTILCSGCDDINIPLDRLRENLNIVVGDIKLEYSAGTVRFDPAVHNNLEDLINQADKEMYKEKKSR